MCHRLIPGLLMTQLMLIACPGAPEVQALAPDQPLQTGQLQAPATAGPGDQLQAPATAGPGDQLQAPATAGPGDQLQAPATAGPGDQLQACVGQKVILPCQLPHPFPPLDEIRVCWQTKATLQKEEEESRNFISGSEEEGVGDERVVHCFNQGQEEFQHQHPSYSNRTRLFSRQQLQAGNFSVELRNISESDNSTVIQCVAYYNGGFKYPSNVTLLVVKRDGSAVSLKHQQQHQNHQHHHHQQQQHHHQRHHHQQQEASPHTLGLLHPSEDAAHTQVLLLQVVVGQAAQLPCLLPPPPPPLRDLRVYWQVAQTDQVLHCFNQGQEEFQHQHPSYSNRTRLFSRQQLQAGNFSVELRNVSESDNNTVIQCVAYYNGGPKYLTNVTLLVVKSDDDGGVSSGAPPANSWVWYVAAGLLVLLMLVLMAVCVARKRCSTWNPHHSTDPESGVGPQDPDECDASLIRGGSPAQAETLDEVGDERGDKTQRNGGQLDSPLSLHSEGEQHQETHV